ncbi:type II toxin-antitoxin system RelE/ParE family toxin [Phormidium sp. CLA17]|uniref:type II toxin-antitoxin system RelE family toxin n=1 Tax=Leptolyngbya sp. Cla-17 TaxID=2803751 RepID=UPI001492563B|nr:type II toxin-antitoxin system RelE/ParE family toxin [Leptolyngbya sp. Cla-17]MBM0741936.1 type II toxin-antitoxin system RelE/ParE family toxin [Leptolyngbya sp. Cla-17]
MKVEFRKSFEKDLGKLRDEDLLAKVKAVIEKIETAESFLDASNIKKLKADGNYYRIRVGNYRIGFVENEGTITFIRVLHRKEMYRYFP